MKDKLYKMMSWPQIEAIVYGEEGNPQSILGRHYVSAYTLYQAFIPNAETVSLKIIGDKKTYPMEMADEAGFFAIALLGKELRDYVYEVTYSDKRIAQIHDPYIYNPALSKEQINEWSKGVSTDAYKFMGSHLTKMDNVEGVVFRVWAPNAIRVSVVGDFNDWNSQSHPMMLDEKTGIFSLFIPDVREGAKYLFDICAKGGKSYRKADPYSGNFISESEFNVVAKEITYNWKFDNKKPVIGNPENAVLNIFEIDNSLWDETEEELTEKSLSEIVSYVSSVGYTHVLINFGTERFFSVNSKLQKNDYLKILVDSFHENGIGVLFKWNPCYFSNEELGIKVFDGTYLYGHLDERIRYNAMFGYNFNYGREGVKNFLMSNLYYYLNEFHFDGVHVDDISTVLYLNYGRGSEDSLTNIYGGTENLEAISFFREMNTSIHSSHAGIISTTKETCMFPSVTSSVKEDGLGFDFIWDNGFGEDYLSFIKDSGRDMHKLTDSMAYAYSENYILTISKEDVYAACDFDYDRVSEGAGYFDTISFKDADKMAIKRATLAFFAAHPGKKLIYLGQDQKELSIKLNRLYKELAAFHELDRYTEGFEWVSAWAGGNGVISFLRKGESFKDNILVVCNFSEENFDEYKLGIPYEGKYKPILCSEDKAFGGEFKMPARAIKSVDEEYDGKESTITVKLPALSVTYFSYEPYSEEEFLKIARNKALRIKKELEKEAQLRGEELEKEALRKAKEYNGLIAKTTRE